MSFYKGKIVVVTGAGSGIGRACAIAYAREGARTHIVDISSERIEAARAEILAAGGEAFCHPLDCTDAAAVKGCAEEILAADGRVDVLQNGVGVLISAPVEEISLEEWRRIININLMSTVNCIHSFLPTMLKQSGSGHIVNIISLSGLVGFPYTVPYTTTKFALVGLSEALSFELYGKGISVTMVCPGAVATNILNDGVLELPGGWTPSIKDSFAHAAMRPEKLAKKVLRAVKRRQSVITGGLAMYLLWLFKRLFDGFFRFVSKRVTNWLVARERRSIEKRSKKQIL